MKKILKYKLFESVNHNWKEVNNKLEKNFQFQDFAEALVFINKISNICEMENHHPEINWIYNKSFTKYTRRRLISSFQTTKYKV